MKRRNDLKAITLIESVLYLAIFGIMFVAVIQFVFTVVDSNRRATIANELDNNIIFLNEHFLDSFEKSDTINTGNTVFDDSDGVLYLDIGANYGSYQITNGRLQYDNNGSVVNISVIDFIVDEFLVEEVRNMSSELVGAKITITLSSLTEVDLYKTLQTSFILPAYE